MRLQASSSRPWSRSLDIPEHLVEIEVTAVID